LNTQRKQVCIQGLGFVGAAMAVAVASARAPDGSCLYQVTGVDRATPQGIARAEALQRGVFPFPTADVTLDEALTRAHESGNLSATTDEVVYTSADVVVIDIAFDFAYREVQPQFQMSDLELAVRSIARRIPEGALVLVETTVPPGTCENVVAPIFREELQRRGLREDAVHLAHSFERVMPGEKYLDSIIRFWRVYAGQTRSAADACEAFLSSIIDVENFPLKRLSSITASETAKVMENTYRAVNIAFIDEWTKYAEAVGIDLYEVTDAIRVRPTHSNIRFPGLGVGGYCLTKDPAFAPTAAKQFYGLEEIEFPFSDLAIKVNNQMPLHTLSRLNILLGGNSNKKSILVLGVSYRQNVGDTRYSPSETLVRVLEDNGAIVASYDPFVEYWSEMDRPLPANMPDSGGFDAIVIATPHQEFRTLDVLKWLGDSRPIILDTANVLTLNVRQECRKVGVQVETIGRSDGL
jgi:nucleotide sugar dehydrogenase